MRDMRLTWGGGGHSLDSEQARKVKNISWLSDNSCMCRFSLLILLDLGEGEQGRCGHLCTIEDPVEIALGGPVLADDIAAQVSRVAPAKVVEDYQLVYSYNAILHFQSCCG